MKIMFISRLFYPQNRIGAIRPSNFARFFHEFGHEVICVVGDPESVRGINYLPEFHLYRVNDGIIGKYLDQRMVRRRNYSASLTENSRASWIKTIRRHAGQILHIIDEVEWYYAARKLCLKIIDESNIDVMVTCYGPEAMVWIGKYIKTKRPMVNWLLDMRDPLDSEQWAWYLKKWFFHLQNKVVHQANLVTIISNGMRDKMLRMHKINANHIFTVENGYEGDPTIVPSIRDNVLRIGYTGTIHEGIQRMDALFKGIIALQKINNSDQLLIEIHYAGLNFQILETQAKRYGVEKYLINHGFIKREEALQLQEQCDILTVLTWNNKNEEGILSGKFLEYLRWCKPILALIDGDLPDSEIAKHLNNMEIGFPFEYIRESEQLPELVSWLNELYSAKQLTHTIPVIPPIDYVSRFKYKELSKKMEKIIMENIMTQSARL